MIDKPIFVKEVQLIKFRDAKKKIYVAQANEKKIIIDGLCGPSMGLLIGSATC